MVEFIEKNTLRLQIEGESVLMNVDKWLDRARITIVERIIAMNGYHMAALIMVVMAIGARIDPRNGVFLSIESTFPLLQSWLWEFVFLGCAFFMWRCKAGRWELPTVALAFILPNTIFYGALLGLVLQNARTSLFLDLLIVLALVIPILFVVRTAGMNYYQDYVVELRLQIAALQKELDSHKAPHEAE